MTVKTGIPTRIYAELRSRIARLRHFSFLPGRFFLQDRAPNPVWVIERQKMTAHILSAKLAPHAQVCVAVLALVLLFLIVEIPLVVSIFKNGTKQKCVKETDK